MSETIAVADVGGTHARFALAEIDGAKVVSMGEPVTLKTGEFASFQTAWHEFGRRVDRPLPPSLGLSFAGPVGGEVLKLTNNPWVIRPALMEDRLGVTRYTIVNDFGAIAQAVAAFGDDCFAHLCGPETSIGEAPTTTILGPGTGLGVAQLHRRDGRAFVVETEGGHIDFAPLDPVEDKILQHLRHSFRRVSIERIVAGIGLANIYRGLASVEGKPALLGDDDLTLWTAAMDGTDELAVAALDRFFLSLGAAAGDLALAHGAQAVVIAGGLGLRLRDRFASSGFEQRFLAKGRFERRMEAIPVKLITHTQPGLYGAAAAFAEAHA